MLTGKQPPFWNYAGLTVRAWTKGEARAMFKRLLKLRTRLPIGAQVTRRDHGDKYN